MVESTEGTNSQVLENKGTYVASKTLFNTNTKNDDDARASETFLMMANRLDTAVKKLLVKVSRNVKQRSGMTSLI